MAKPHSSYSGWVNWCLKHRLSFVPLVLVTLLSPAIFLGVLLVVGGRAAVTAVAEHLRDALELAGQEPQRVLADRSLALWVRWCLEHRMPWAPLIAVVLAAPGIFSVVFLTKGVPQATQDTIRNLGDAWALTREDDLQPIG